MQRDNDLIRKLLLEIEGSKDRLYMMSVVMNMSQEQHKKYYHLQLLADAGMLEESGKGVFRMTNMGHDFVEAIRNEGRWNSVKAGAAKVGGASLDMMAGIAKEYVRAELTKRLGIEL